jgi:DNA-binding beta-propeller fold protein YncE
MKKILAASAVIAVLGALIVSDRAMGARAGAQGARQAPMFQVEPGFFKLPANMIIGQGSAVATDRQDHLWVIHRPRYIPADKRAQAAPPVMEFDANGNYLQGWGGFADAYDWPDQEHGIYVDEKDFVWISGSARPALRGPGDRVLRSDNMLLKFTKQGKFVMQIGKRDTSIGNKDTRNVYSATDMFAYPKTNELFVADGYINRRAIVFDRDTGAFKRMWGAFGNPAIDPPGLLDEARTPPRPREANPAPQAQAAAPASNAAAERAKDTDASGKYIGPPQFIGAVHAIEVSNDGTVYVADRSSGRVQTFTLEGKYIKQLIVDGPAGIALSTDPEQRFMYVVNMGGSKIIVVDRRSLEVLYQFGERSPKPGDFEGVHHIAIDSKGNLYTAEAEPGNRFQKFTYKGLGPAPTQ